MLTAAAVPSGRGRRQADYAAGCRAAGADVHLESDRAVTCGDARAGAEPGGDRGRGRRYGGLAVYLKRALDVERPSGRAACVVLAEELVSRRAVFNDKGKRAAGRAAALHE